MTSSRRIPMLLRPFVRLVLVPAFVVSVTNAVQPPNRKPLPNLDLRQPDPSTAIAIAARQGAQERLTSLPPGSRVDWDRVTGAPALISRGDRLLSGPLGGNAILPATLALHRSEDPHRIVKAFLQEHRQLFGHGAEALDAARIRREFIASHSGLRTMVWGQEFQGIDVFEGAFIAHVTRDGALVNVSSKFICHPPAAAERGTANYVAAADKPPITAREAVWLAARNVGEAGELSQITAVAKDNAGGKRQLFQAPFLSETADVELTWLPLDAERLRLCWEVVLTSRTRKEMFQIVVDAVTGGIWLRRGLTEYVSDASYRVYASDSPSPFSPGHGAPSGTQPPLTARTLVTLPAWDTNASPSGWIDDGVNETRGNNVDAHSDRDDDNVADLPRPQGSPERVFDFPVDLNQEPGTYTSAAIVELFFWNNWIHDRYYQLGFTEAAGNFQLSNFDRGGLGGDAVRADAQDGGGFDNANFSTPRDGSPPRMQMYLWNGPVPDRDGDFDAEIIIHEYTHGLSNRRVGGGVGMSALQSRGMGEGWSDFYALALLSQPADDVNGVYAMAAYTTYLWSANYTQNYYFGLRRYPYTTDLTRNPLTFKDIDPGQADFCSSGAPYNSRFTSCSTSGADEVHDIGEVWCATLWEARANMIQKHGWTIGNELILQLVTDGMNLSPPNPDFIQARDGILQADVVNHGGVNRNELWAAFAKRGLGAGASSPSSATADGVVESFAVPDTFYLFPFTGFIASGPFNGPFHPSNQTFTLDNLSGHTLVWTAATPDPWLTIFPASGSLAANASSTVEVFINPNATNLPLGIFSGAAWFTNVTSGIAQRREITLRRLIPVAEAVDAEPLYWQTYGHSNWVGQTVVAHDQVDAGESGILPPSSQSHLQTILIGPGAFSFWWKVSSRTNSNALTFSTNGVSAAVISGEVDWQFRSLDIPAGIHLVRWTYAKGSATTNLRLDKGWVDEATYVPAAAGAPLVHIGPANETRPVGGDVTFVVNAGGTLPLSYQWRLDGAAIASATNLSFSLTNLQSYQSGSRFDCAITNAFGSATTRLVRLTILTNRIRAAIMSNLGSSFDDDIKAKVVGTGLFNAADVDIYPVRTNPPPPVSQMLQYAAILTASYFASSYSEPTNVGNAFADYVDAGGNLLVASTALNRFVGLSGRIATGDYLPLVADLSHDAGRLTMVQDRPDHPIVDGVRFLVGGPNTYHSHVSVTAGSEWVARWSDGHALVATREARGRRIVGLNLIPVSTDCQSRAWESWSDGGMLLANAFLWAGSREVRPDPCFAASPGLIAWWPANGSAADIAGLHHGALRDGAGFASGRRGPSFSFGGTAHVEVPESPAWEFGTNDFTIELWANFGESTGRRPFVASDNSSAGGTNEWAFWLDNRSLFFHISGAEGVHDIGGVSFNPTPGQWRHVAVRRAGSEFSFFTNGLFAGVATAPYYVPGLGARLTLAQAQGGFHFLGQLDEIGIYHRALADHEIAGTYFAGQAGRCYENAWPILIDQPAHQTVLANSTAQFQVTAAGVELHYRWFHRTNALAFADQPVLSLSNVTAAQAGPYTVVVANDYGAITSTVARLTVIGTNCPGALADLVAWWPADGSADDSAGAHHGVLASGAAFAPGKAGQAFQFTGPAHVAVQDSPAWHFDRNDFTIELWANFANANGRRPFLASDNGGGFLNKWIFWLDYGNLIFHINGPGAGGYGDLGVVPFNPIPGEWYHLAMTRAGNEFAFFTNGVLAKTHVESRSVPNADLPLTIGQAETAFLFEGQLDEIAIYRRALSTNDVRTIFLNGAEGKCPDPPGPFAFDTSPEGVRWTTNGVQLQLTGLSGYSAVVIHASTNLTTWEPIQTNAPAGGSVLITDPAAPGFPWRFYRAVAQPRTLE